MEIKPRRTGSTCSSISPGGPAEMMRPWQSLVRLTAGLLVGLLVLLVGVASQIALVSSVIVPTVVNTDSYVRLVGPLAKDPDIQEQIVNSAMDAIDQAQRDKLPSGIAFLRGPAEKLLRSQAKRVVDSDWFASLWVKTNRIAHQQLIEILEGDSLISDSGALDLDLSPVIKHILDSVSIFGSVGLDPLDLSLTIQLVSDNDLQRARSAYRAVKQVNGLLPWGTVIVAALAVALSRRPVRKASITLSVIVVSSLITAAAIHLSAQALAPDPSSVANALLRRSLLDLSGSITDRLTVAAVTAAVLLLGIRTVCASSRARPISKATAGTSESPPAVSNIR
jgi:hypothetical protein